MKFVFTTRTKRAFPQLGEGEDRSGRRGYGSKKATGSGRVAKARILKRKITVEVVSRPKLSEEDIQARNVAEWGRICAIGAHIELAQAHFAEEASINKILASLVIQYQNVVKLFSSIYEKEHGQTPPQLVTKRVREYNDVDLARWYARVAIELSTVPSQLALSELSGIGQSTWSRAFQRLIFWEQVNACFESFRNALPAIEDNLARIRHRKDANKAVDLQEFHGADLSAEDALLDHIDMRRLQAIPRETVIKRIIRAQPRVKRVELDNKTDDELRNLLFVLLRD